MAFGLSATASAALADPDYYVVTPYNNEGVRLLDVRYWTVKPAGGHATRWPEIGLGYGVNSRWTTEIYASYEGASDEATHLETLNWQNDVLLTQGQYPFDLALHATWTHVQDATGDAIEYGPVFQTEIGRTQLNGNLFLFKQFHTDNAGPAALRYQWQVKQPWKPVLAFGLQGLGDLGPWDHWAPNSGQSHRAGPAVFGHWRLDDARDIRYDAACLFGTVYHGNSAGMFTMRVWYAF
jgi:hypothetical protein